MRILIIGANINDEKVVSESLVEMKFDILKNVKKEIL